MISIISPAKGFFKIPCPDNITSTDCIFKDKTKELIDILQTYTTEDISTLMKTSEDISTLNFNRFQNFYTNNINEHIALLFISGEAYKAIDSSTLSYKDLTFAQDNLRILSGLYGLIRPLDIIKEYRLEMGTKLKNNFGKDLYSFWKESLTNELLRELDNTTGDKILLNVASEEYSKSIDLKAINKHYPVVNVHFKENKNGNFKVIGMYAKKARGQFIRFILQNQIEALVDVKKFNIDLSDEKNLIFTR